MILMGSLEKVINVNNGGGVHEKKLKFSEKLFATILDGTGTFHLQVIQLFLLFFYTDVMKISPAYVAGLFLISRIIDALMAPAFGIIIDKVTTPWGKYKPWVILMGLGTGVFGWLTYTVPDLGPNERVVYATVTYVIYSLFLSIASAPSNALRPAITKNINDRLSMGQIAYFVVMVGALLSQIAVQPTYKALGGGDDAKGFSLVMGIMAIIAIIVSVFQFYSIKERYVIQKGQSEKGPTLKEMSLAVFTNKTAIIVYLFVLGINLGNGIRSGASIYYFKYYFGNESLLAIVGLVSIVPTMIGVALSSKITKKMGIKKNLMIGMIFNIVGTAAALFLPPSAIGEVLYMILAAITSLFVGLSTPAQGTMLPAAMDYTEWKTKMNVNGFMASFQGFLQTFATALSGAITAGFLALIGYESGVEQSNETLLGLRILMSIVPAIAILLTLSVWWFDLTEEKQALITKELEERRFNPEYDDMIDN